MSFLVPNPRWLHAGWLALAALLLPIRGEDAPSLRIIPDAWPRRPRIIGYEYHMKDRRNIPTEGTGRPRVDLLPPGKGKYRLVAVEVQNPGAEPLEATILSPHIKRSRSPKVVVPPGGKLRRFFDLKVKGKEKQFEFKLIGVRRSRLASAKVPIPERGRLGTRGETRRLARELNHEEEVRERFRMHPVRLGVVDEEGRPVEGASLTLLHERTGWLETGATDGNGRWKGRLLAGSWKVMARKVFPLPPVDPQSTVIPPTRCLYLATTLSVEGTAESVLSPGASTPITVENEEGVPIGLDRFWLAPRGIAEPLHFADVARRARGAFLLDVNRRVERGGVEVLGSPGLAYEIGAFVRPGQVAGAILVAVAEMSGEPIRMKLESERMGRLRLDLSGAPEGAEGIGFAVSLPESIRVEVSFRVTRDAVLYVPAGAVRTRVSLAMKGGDRMDFAPHTVALGPGAEADLTPRLPLVLTPYLMRSDGLQVWLALQDAGGRIVDSLVGEGKVKAAYDGKLLFEGNLADLRYQFPTGVDEVDIRKVAFAATLRLGERELKWRAPAEEFRKFQGEGAEVVAPGILGDHAEPYLEISRKSLVGSQKVMGLPKGIQRISNRFVVFLPPDVGGLGGGGQIRLGLQDLVRFAARTDPLPWAYRHEFGHNLGFGHDPYMFLAPCGIDDEILGRVGYRMIHGSTLHRALEYLTRAHPDPPAPWEPSGDVFAPLGLLYGPEIHKKMFQVRATSQGVLREMGLSVIERIAVQYCVAAGENLAWLFRAFGWPVLDERVILGVLAMERQAIRREGRIPRKVQGLVVRDWWVQGPVALRRPGAPPKKVVEPPPPWRYLAWREEFIDLPDGPPAGKAVGYRLFHRVQAAVKVPGLLVCGSDVQLDILVNGQTVSRIHASPQRRQPRHDDYRLEEWAQSVIPIVFEKGDNLIEAVAIQPPGSKGFFLEIAGYDGKPLQEIRLRAAGPEDDEGGRKRPRLLEARPPVHNPSFEAGERSPHPWILGPVEPKGAVQWVWDTASAARGKRSALLRLQGPSRGALIQRIVLEPETEYLLSGRMKADDLGGKDCEAYIGIFLQDPFEGSLARTDPFGPGSTRWVAVETKFFPRKRRVAYIGCVVKGQEGAVRFDEVHLIRK